MKIPQTPPDFRDILLDIAQRGRMQEIIQFRPEDDHYLHWDKLRRKPAPSGFTHKEWWFALKQRRLSMLKPTVLKAKSGQFFQYAMPDPVPQRLHEIDMWGGGAIEMSEQIANPDTRDRYYVSSLIEEAISSSLLEGATTTRRVAKEMLRSSRSPQNKSERMIMNNFRTMRKIRDLRDEPLSKELVFELHRLMTDHTLDDPTAAGRFRTSREPIAVYGEHDELLHKPPEASTLPGRMEAMCEFANAESHEQFLHPAIRSIILHFWLAYDHPFCDGNGRTARALFYWSMLRRGYWLFEFITISQIIMNAPAQYGLAFLHTETDDNDLTYFILYHINVVNRALEALREYLARKSKEIQQLEASIRGLRILNHRQRALVSHGLKNANALYTIESHRLSHNVSYQTARTDLLDLRHRGIFVSEHVGRRLEFRPAANLEELLRALDSAD